VPLEIDDRLNRVLGALFDIRQFCSIIIDVIKGVNFGTFLSDIKIQSTVKLHLIQIGEAAKNVDEEFRVAHADVDWNKTVGLRNILVHRYYQIDLRTIWDIVQVNIPKLYKVVSDLIIELDPDSSVGES
jgi:uncharacterized protein with HEPN domain